MDKKSSEILKTKDTSELKKFITSVIDLAKSPQSFKQWIKEKKSWKHNLNIPEEVGVSDNIEIKKTEKKK
jgi:hypothetical protein